jgi:histidyl-tRNA synthetase
MSVAKLLWERNIPTEYSSLDNPKFKKQLDEVLERHIPVMVVFGDDEIARGVVKIKNMKLHEEIEVPLADVVTAVLNAGAKDTTSDNNLNLLTALR